MDQKVFYAIELGMTIHDTDDRTVGTCSAVSAADGIAY